jgi:hypothetical protein
MKKISTKNFRDVEDRLAERGITVSHETVRPWVNQSALGLLFAGLAFHLPCKKCRLTLGMSALAQEAASVRFHPP